MLILTFLGLGKSLFLRAHHHLSPANVLTLVILYVSASSIFGMQVIVYTWVKFALCQLSWVNKTIWIIIFPLMQPCDPWMDFGDWYFHLERNVSSATQVCLFFINYFLFSLLVFKTVNDLCLSISATADTCVAMSEWVERPSSNTALDEILPCTDNATAQETLMRSKEVTGQLVELINTVVTNISNINFSPVFVQMYYNQSGPLLPMLCNPFNHDLTDRPCSPGELDLNNATQAWSSFVCQVNQNGTCITTGRLTPALYGQMASCANISTGLINNAPFLVQLQDCSYAKQTFRDITNNNCPGLRRYGYRVYVGLAILSTAVMLSLVFWIICSRERRQRKEGLPEYSGSKEIVRVNFWCILLFFSISQ